MVSDSGQRSVENSEEVDEEMEKVDMEEED